MDDRTEKIGTNDLGLIVFAVVAMWLLVWQSGLF